MKLNSKLYVLYLVFWSTASPHPQQGYSNILDSIAEDPILNAIVKFKGRPSINKI